MSTEAQPEGQDDLPAVGATRKSQARRFAPLRLSFQDSPEGETPTS